MRWKMALLLGLILCCAALVQASPGQTEMLLYDLSSTEELMTLTTWPSHYWGDSRARAYTLTLEFWLDGELAYSWSRAGLWAETIPCKRWSPPHEGTLTVRGRVRYSDGSFGDWHSVTGSIALAQGPICVANGSTPTQLAAYVSWQAHGFDVDGKPPYRVEFELLKEGEVYTAWSRPGWYVQTVNYKWVWFEPCCEGASVSVRARVVNRDGSTGEWQISTKRMIFYPEV